MGEFFKDFLGALILLPLPLFFLLAPYGFDKLSHQATNKKELRSSRGADFRFFQSRCGNSLSAKAENNIILNNIKQIKTTLNNIKYLKTW